MIPLCFSDSYRCDSVHKCSGCVFNAADCDWSGPGPHLEMIGDLLKELSNHSERVEERRAALLELLKVTRDDSLVVWEEHFKTMLLLLLETLGDKDVRETHSYTVLDSQNMTAHGPTIKNSTDAVKEGLCPSAAHHPSAGSACPEGDHAQSTGALQELRRTHHHENPGGP